MQPTRNLVLKLIAAFTLLFAVCIAIIRAQPYDDSNLRPLVSPQGCPMPCFMGIRLGLTQLDEAVAILDTHEWVQDYMVHLSTYSGVFLTWRWSGRQPHFIDSTMPGGLGTGNTNVVERIDVFTRVPLGDFLAWQSPAEGGLRCTSAARITGLFVHYAENFSAEAMMPSVRCLRGGSHCPMTLHELWFSPSMVTIGDNYLPRTDFARLLRNPGCDS